MKAQIFQRMAHSVLLSQGNLKKTKHVAFILRGRKLLAVGVNSTKTHPIAKRLKKQRFAETQCAELNACIKMGITHRDFSGDFRDLTLVVVRINQFGELAMSRPCVGCQQLINQLKFRRVFFSDENQRLVRDHSQST